MTRRRRRGKRGKTAGLIAFHLRYRYDPPQASRQTRVNGGTNCDSLNEVGQLAKNNSKTRNRVTRNRLPAIGHLQSGDPQSNEVGKNTSSKTRNRVTRNRFGLEKNRPARNVSPRKSSEIHGYYVPYRAKSTVRRGNRQSPDTRNRVTRNRFGLEKNRPARNAST
jgi:hypothetical protein